MASFSYSPESTPVEHVITLPDNSSIILRQHKVDRLTSVLTFHSVIPDRNDPTNRLIKPPPAGFECIEVDGQDRFKVEPWMHSFVIRSDASYIIRLDNVHLLSISNKRTQVYDILAPASVRDPLPLRLLTANMANMTLAELNRMYPCMALALAHGIDQQDIMPPGR